MGLLSPSLLPSSIGHGMWTGFAPRVPRRQELNQRMLVLNNLDLPSIPVCENPVLRCPSVSASTSVQ